MRFGMGLSKRRLLASAAAASLLIICCDMLGAQAALAQPAPQDGASGSRALPPVTVDQPEKKRPRSTASSFRPRGQASGAANRKRDVVPPHAVTQPAAPRNLNSTMGQPPEFAGGQVARGGQVGVLGNLDYMSTPFSTQNFTEAFIKNQQVTTVQDIMLSDPSVSFAQSGSRQSVDYIKIRGFADYAGQEGTSVKGLVGLAAYYPPSPEFLERLELIKGPNALLNGAPGAVGGSINLVTKRAADKPILDVTGSFGSESQSGGAIDFGTRYGDNMQYGIRINAFGRDGNLAIDGYRGKQEGVAVGWDFRGERFRVDADLIYRDQKFYGDPYYSTLADPSLGLPRAPDPKINLTAPWIYNSAKALLAMTRAEYDLNEAWTVSGAYGHSLSADRFSSYCFNIINNLKGDATCSGGPTNAEYDRDAANLALRGNFFTGAAKHRLAVGGNYIGETISAQPGLLAAPAIDFNIYAPVWPAAFPDPGFGGTNKQNENTTRGLFLTDTVSILDERLNLILGVRRTEIDQATFDTATGTQLTSSSAAAVTPTIGSLIKLTPWLSLYGNYIEALERGGIAPQTAVNAGQAFPALVSKQQEYGAKFDFQAIGATVAYYDINKANQYLDAATAVFTQNGRQENKGYEVMVFGEPVKGIRFIAGAAWVDARQINTDSGLYDGKKVASVPNSEYRLTAEFDMPFHPALTLIGAVYHAGPAPYDNLNSFDVPAWTRYDVGLRYVYMVDKVKMTARFKIENLTNEAYWIAGYGSGGLATSGARRFLASLTASFFEPGDAGLRRGFAP
jgi:iron complex outermembrane receptor protein